MLPSYPTLPSLVSQFICVKCLGEANYQLPFDPIDNPLVGTSIPKDVPCTTAFFAKYWEGTVCDGFYQIKACAGAGLELPSPCIIKVLHWSLDFDSELSLTIVKASVVSTLLSDNQSEVCKVANNLQVTGLLHRMRYGLVKQERLRATDQPSVIIEPTSSLVVEPTRPPAEIGFGQQGRDKVKAFTKERKAAKPVADDLLEAIKPPELAYTEDDIFRAIQEEEGVQLNTIVLDSDDEFAFDVFPQWALKYLRLCYGM